MYKNAYPRINRKVRLDGYLPGQQMNFRATLSKAKRLENHWKCFNREQEALGDKCIVTPLENNEPWTQVTSQRQFIKIIQMIDDGISIFQFTGMVADTASTGPPTNFVAISTRNRNRHTSIGSASVFIVSSFDNLPLKVIKRYDWQPINHQFTRVILYVDSSEGIFVIAEGPAEELLWTELLVYSLEETGKEAKLRFAIPCRQNLTITRVFTMDSHLILLGWTNKLEGALIRYDLRSDMFIDRKIFGEGVEWIGEGKPYCNQIILTGHRDHTIQVWEYTTCECVAILRGHSASIWGFAFSDDAADRDEKQNWVPPSSLVIFSAAEPPETSNMKYTECISWCLDDIPRNLARNNSLVDRDADRMIHRLVLNKEDMSLITSFYVLHPLLYTMSPFGDFCVTNMESGQVIYRISGISDLASNARILHVPFVNIHRLSTGRLIVFLESGIVEIRQKLEVL